MKVRRTQVAFVIMVILISFGVVAEASLIVYDGFADGGNTPVAGEYLTSPNSNDGSGTNNNSLVNQDPALSPGFATGDNWSLVSGTTLSDSTYYRADGGGLGYTDPLGNALDTTPGQVTLFRDTAGSDSHRQIIRASNDTGVKPTEMYFSGLIETTADIAGYLQTKWGDKSLIGIGLASDGTALVNVGTSTKGASTSTFAPNQTHLLVGKIVDNGAGVGNDSVTLYVDPVNLTDEALNTAAIANVDLDDSYYVSNNASYALNSIALGGHSIENHTVQLDEFRIGTDWADVVPFTWSPPPPEQTLDAVADAYVQTGSTTNYGSSAELRTKYNDNDNFHRKSYVQFDLSTLDFDHETELADATLMLNLIDSGAGSNDSNKLWEFEVYGLNDGNAGENWVENTIIWNNAPANDTSSGFETTADATSLGTFEVLGKGLGLVEFSSTALTDFVASSTADDLLTFILVRNTRGLSDTTYVHAFASRENSNFPGPQLVLQQVVPEPSTITILVLGLFALPYLLRSRRRA